MPYASILAEVTVNWNMLFLALALAAALAGSGCSGINASGSVSPASFFLPGLLQNEPANPDPTIPFPAPDQASILAQAR